MKQLFCQIKSLVFCVDLPRSFVRHDCCLSCLKLLLLMKVAWWKMKGLRITTRRLSNGSIIIALHGFVDSYTSGKFKRAIDRLFKLRIYNLLIDLSQVSYLGCAATSIFLSAWSAVKNNNGDLVLVRPRPQVKELFDLLGFSRMFTIKKDIPSAISLFKSA